MVGTGIDPEGIDNNPAYYTLVLEATWQTAWQTSANATNTGTGTANTTNATNNGTGTDTDTGAGTAIVGGSYGGDEAQRQRRPLAPAGVDVAAWLDGWSAQRCGRKAASASKAWAALLNTVYKNSSKQIYEHHMKYCPSTIPDGAGW